MNTQIVLTVIADDHPGIINTVSTVIHNHGGNWTQSSMSSLAGQFAGILLVSIPEEKAKSCLEKLHGLESSGLRIVANLSHAKPEQEESRKYALDLVGNDRLGIVNDITTLLTSHQVSVHELETSVESASMSGGTLFKARAVLEVPASVDTDMLADELEDLANDLMVDIRFE